MIIDATTLLDVVAFQEKYPDFRAVTNCDREKVGLEMEVLLRNNGEYFRARVDEINGNIIVGKVLREDFYFKQPFKYQDMIRFEKKNIINIYVINGVYY